MSDGSNRKSIDRAIKRKFKKGLSLIHDRSHIYLELILQSMEVMATTLPKRTYITQIQRSFNKKINNEEAHIPPYQLAGNYPTHFIRQDR